MLIAPPTPDEPRRLALLRSTGLLDSAPEPSFDAITRLVARTLKVPIALVSLVDEHRQWFKSNVGLAVSETPRDPAFCAHALHSDGPFVIPDAHLDARFHDNPLVTGAPFVRAYAGVPLRSSECLALGTLCAIDRVPREFTSEELASLQDLAELARREIVQRQALGHLHAVVDDQTDIVSRFDAQGQLVFANETARRLFGLDAAGGALPTWQSVVWPADFPAVRARLRNLSPEQPLVHNEHRVTDASGRVRWVDFVTRGLFDAQGRLEEVQCVGRDVTERKALEARLAEASETLQDLYDHAPCGYYALDERGIFLKVNRIALQWLGCTEEEVLGRCGPADFFSPEDRARFLEVFPRFVAGEKMIAGGPGEFDLHSRDGTVRRISVSASAVRDAAGRFVRTRTVIYDVTELDRVRRELQRLNREQSLMLENELIGMVRLRDRRIVWKNGTVERMFGYAPGELDGQGIRVLYADDATYHALGEAAYPALRRGETFRTQVALRRKSGEPVWVDFSGGMLSEETGESMWLMLDITAMKLYQAQVEQMAFHDALTGLPNRLLLLDRMTQAISRCQRDEGLLAVCFLDLDGFKAINDRLGHEAGDQLLKAVASRLSDCVRSHDTVARLGGDEFVLVLTHLRSRTECDVVLSRVMKAIREPVQLGPGRVGEVSASIGIACYPGDADGPSELLAAADAAMYRTKQSGRDRARTA